VLLREPQAGDLLKQAALRNCQAQVRKPLAKNVLMQAVLRE